MFTMNFNDQAPLYRQLYEKIITLILEGRLKSGEKLPSKRQLSEHIHISIRTIETAYDQLLAEGYIFSRPKRGYYVSPIDPGRVHLETTDFPVEVTVSQTPEYKYDFRTNSSDTSNFPFSVWSGLMRETLRNEGSHILKQKDHAGLYELRKEIARYLKSYRNISVSPDRIIIGAGSEYLINLVIQLLCIHNNGIEQIFAVENPGYHKIARILTANRIKTKYIAMDSKGINVNSLKSCHANVVHVTPSHHFPLGTVMPVGRRYELLNWASDTSSYIIEDDYDSEFRYTGHPIPALESLDTNGRVIYINTFAKNLAPSLRISYMVLPDSLTKTFNSCFSFYSNTVSSFEQYTLARFMSEGHFERYINRMRLIYKQKMELLTACITSSPLNNYTETSKCDTGLHLLVTVKNGMSESALVQKAAFAGIMLKGISEFCHGDCAGYPMIILGFAGISSDSIPNAVKSLSKAWNTDDNSKNFTPL